MAKSTAGRASTSRPEPYVLHIIESDVAVRFSLMLHQALQILGSGGLRTRLLTDDADLAARVAETEVECHWLPRLGGWRGWRLGQQLTARYSPPPRLVHLWGTSGLWWIQRWVHRQGIPLLIQVLGARHLERLIGHGLQGAEQILAPSTALLTPLLERFPSAAGRAVVLPPAVALPIRPTAARDPARTLSVLCVMGLHDQAGLHVLVDAVGQLHQSEHDLQVAVVGAGGPAGAGWARIRERHVQDCFSVVNEPWLWERVLPEADVIVVPSVQRDLWLAPLLAMGLGKVVIASRDQPAEWFVENKTAWQFTPGSVVELAYLLERALEHPKHARELSDQAAEYVRTHHALGEMVARLMSIYQTIVGDGVTVLASADNRGANADS